MTPKYIFVSKSCICRIYISFRRGNQPHKPPSKSFQVNYSTIIQNALKYCMRHRHIGSTILNFEILTSDSQYTIPQTLEMTAFTFHPFSKN